MLEARVGLGFEKPSVKANTVAVHLEVPIPHEIVFLGE